MTKHFAAMSLSFDPREQAGADSHSYRQALTNLICQKKSDASETEILKMITVLAVAGTATLRKSRRFAMSRDSAAML